MSAAALQPCAGSSGRDSIDVGGSGEGHDLQVLPMDRLVALPDAATVLTELRRGRTR